MTWTPDSHTHNAAGYLVRHQKQRERRGAVERFCAMTEQVEAGAETPCIVFTGGDTFRVDDYTVTTPIRFAYEMVMGEPPPQNKRFWMRCKTKGCVRLSHVKAKSLI